MSYPNIYLKSTSHQDRCMKADINSKRGDVRRCKHGRLQINLESEEVRGGRWTDLSYLDHPILKWRAKRRLTQDAREDG